MCRSNKFTYVLCLDVLNIQSVIKLVEIYREPKRTKNVEVQITLAYNAEIATKEALKAMKQSLTAEDVELMEQIDKLVTE